MSDEIEIVIGRCIDHGGLFLFDPLRVPSITWDESSGLSTEHALFRYAAVHAALHGEECDSECSSGYQVIAERGVPKPVCPRCARQLNLALAGLEMPLIPEEDTAVTAARSRR
jgi:hypothetical protein